MSSISNFHIFFFLLFLIFGSFFFVFVSKLLFVFPLNIYVLAFVILFVGFGYN